ncbi:hypothetical protein YTPLAS18_29920 [Nitrospira sp.]|nr:hypothetical protein YTPLAS18_29920 [Nitrospira sp.]
MQNTNRPKLHVLEGAVEKGCRGIVAVLKEGGPPNLDEAIGFVLAQGRDEWLMDVLTAESTPDYVRVRCAHHLARDGQGEAAVPAMRALARNPSEDLETRYWAALWPGQHGQLSALEAIASDEIVPRRLRITARRELEFLVGLG